MCIRDRVGGASAGVRKGLDRREEYRRRGPYLERSPTLTGDASASQTAQPGGQTYTVKAGDTLSKIAKDLLGNANAYPKIFEANRDQLSDPDKIKPGQVLKIPARG